MDEHIGQVRTCCFSLLNDRSSGTEKDCSLAGDVTVYILTLKDQIGRAKALLAVQKLKMFVGLMFNWFLFVFCLVLTAGFCCTGWSSRFSWRAGDLFDSLFNTFNE